MTEAGLISLFLFLHVGAAIIAFGPSFVFPIIGAMGAKEPMHGNFGLRISEKIEDRLVLPFALTMPVSGAFLIALTHFNLASGNFLWLDVAIVLYVIALTIAVVLQRPAIQKMVRLTDRPPAGAPGGPGAAGGPPAGAPAGPPPEVRETAAKIRRNGMMLTILIVVIVFLMVVKPGLV